MAKKKLPVGFTERDNGTLQYRFSVEGRRFSVYGQTVKECRVKELEKREELAAGLTGSARTFTVEKWLTQWLEGRAGRLSGSAIRTNNQHLRRACRQLIGGRAFGSIRLEKLEAVHVRQLQSTLAGQFTTRTTNDTIAFLKQGLNAAVNERVINWNPVCAVESLKRTEEPARDTIHRCLTREEVAAFLLEAGKQRSNYRNLYIFRLNHKTCGI